jgi:aldehyde:ferredoxin oxidoreductase
LFNCREGFTSEDDTLPDRLFDDPIPYGPSKGQVIDKYSFELMKKEYYEIQGWEIETGLPSLELQDYIL